MEEQAAYGERQKPSWFGMVSYRTLRDTILGLYTNRTLNGENMPEHYRRVRAAGTDPLEGTWSGSFHERGEEITCVLTIGRGEGGTFTLLWERDGVPTWTGEGFVIDSRLVATYRSA